MHKARNITFQCSLLTSKFKENSVRRKYIYFNCCLTLQIEIDFQILHKGKENCLLEKWNVIKDHLIKLLKVSRLPKEDKNYLVLLPTLQISNNIIIII